MRVLLSLMLLVATGYAAAEVPAPRPRPAEARDPTAAAKPEQTPAVPEKVDRAAERVCQAELTAIGAIYEDAAAIAEGACGAPAPVNLSAVGAIRLEPPPTLRCQTALATAKWLARVVAPSAEVHLGGEVASVRVAAGYHCRTRRGGSGGGRLSEHARANAVDVSAIVLSGGEAVPVQPRPGSSDPDRAFQAAVRGGACALFTTVLGPGSNEAHADHLHMDLAERRGGYRLCE